MSFNPDARDENGQSPMMAASEAGQLEIVDFLARCGAPVNAADPNGITPLHLACQGGHLDVVRYLVSRGANINALTTQNVTPIMVAAAWDYPEVANLLLKAGADPYSLDVIGQNAFDIALDKNSTGVLSILTAFRSGGL